MRGRKIFSPDEPPGLVFSVTYPRGSLAPSAFQSFRWVRAKEKWNMWMMVSDVCEQNVEHLAAVSPIDKSRKNEALPTVRGEKLFCLWGSHVNSGEPVSKRPFCPISASGKNFNPRNIKYIPVVKIFAFLDLEQN